MRAIINGLVILLISGVLIIPALSQESSPQSDGYVAKLGKIARNNLHRAKLSNGQNVPSETPAEKAQPLLPMTDMKRVVDHGIRAGMMRQCNLNWQQEFTNFMAKERQKEVWSDKQLAYIGLLHGFSMGFTEGELAGKGGCTPALKAYFSKK